MKMFYGAMVAAAVVLLGAADEIHAGPTSRKRGGNLPRLDAQRRAKLEERFAEAKRLMYSDQWPRCYAAYLDLYRVVPKANHDPEILWGLAKCGDEIIAKKGGDVEDRRLHVMEVQGWYTFYLQREMRPEFVTGVGSRAWQARVRIPKLQDMVAVLGGVKHRTEGAEIEDRDALADVLLTSVRSGGLSSPAGDGSSTPPVPDRVTIRPEASGLQFQRHPETPAACGTQPLWTRGGGPNRDALEEIAALLRQHTEIRITAALAQELHNIVLGVFRAVVGSDALRDRFGVMPYDADLARAIVHYGDDVTVAPLDRCQDLRPAVAWAMNQWRAPAPERAPTAIPETRVTVAAPPDPPADVQEDAPPDAKTASGADGALAESPQDRFRRCLKEGKLHGEFVPGPDGKMKLVFKDIPSECR